MLGRADADAEDLAFALELAQAVQCERVAVPRARPGVQLDKVYALDAEVAQALLQLCVRNFAWTSSVIGGRSLTPQFISA